MKYLLFALAALLTVAVVTAHAQSIYSVNCAALSGSPYMCIKNASPFPVVAVQAAGSNMFSPNRWIQIPGGAIVSGGTAVVKFDSWAGCRQYVSIRTASGAVHTYPFVDVCANTSFVIQGW